ncbi:MAG: cytochrome c oxidase subunit II [Planctomycetota bacterium]|nr:MAG: cytochrome c oxidase subunit II [Planctomycetota bacterium]
MGKFWSLIFLLVPILGVACFALAPVYNHWLPSDVSQHGHTIDHLFYFILWLTGAVFIATEVVLFWFLWRYDGKRKGHVNYTHGSHSLEIIWTILPAATLLFIAIYQMNAWAESKIRNPAAGPDGILGTADDMPPTLEVTGRQFEWRLRYPGKNGQLGDSDDIYIVNDLHLPVNEEILIYLKSDDVLHSFFLPNLRVKQDAVPGMKIPVWFRATEKGTYDIVCAELCGWGHYKMKGQLTIESRAEYDEWLDKKYREQTATVGPQLASQGDGE